jgi:hypothetical protein
MLQNDILIKKIRQYGGRISNNNEACGLPDWQWQKLPSQSVVRDIGPKSLFAVHSSDEMISDYG